MDLVTQTDHMENLRTYKGTHRHAQKTVFQHTQQQSDIQAIWNLHVNLFKMFEGTCQTCQDLPCRSLCSYSTVHMQSGGGRGLRCYWRGGWSRRTLWRQHHVTWHELDRWIRWYSWWIPILFPGTFMIIPMDPHGNLHWHHGQYLHHWLWVKHGPRWLEKILDS